MNHLTGISQPRIFNVSSFIDEGCSGNPAGVCLLPHQYDEDFYKKTAISIGAPETSFIYQDKDTLVLKWYTRNGTEVAACGHGTLAAAHILFKQGFFEPSQAINFSTLGGILTAATDGKYISLDFPLEEILEEKSPRYDFRALLGISPVYTGRARYDYFIVAENEDEIFELSPDLNDLMQVETRGIIVTARSRQLEYDYVNRFFAPRVGINEDPVTGSAHTSLGIYWGGVLDKNSLTGYQASPEGGVVRVTLLKDRVQLSGKVRD